MIRLSRRGHVVIACAVLTVPALAAIGVAEPAYASVPGLQVISADSATNSSSPKTAVATCPTGKQVLSVGARIDGGGGQVLLDDAYPNSSLTSVTAKAYEDDDGTTAQWFIRAYAVCVNARQNLELVSKTTDASSSPGQSIDFPCPSGKAVVGVGVAINAGNGNVSLMFMRPISGVGPNRVSVGAREDQDGTANVWSITGYAICDLALPGQVLVTATSPLNSSSKSQNANCQDGRVVVGSGVEVIGGNSSSGAEVNIHELRPPTGQNPSFPLTTFVAATAFEDQDGYSGSWQLRTYAVCASP